MSHPLMRKYPVGSNPAFLRAGHVRWVTSCVLAVVVVLAPLLLGNGFASEDVYDKWRVPPGQPEQMRSQVHYDPNLMDTFFESDADGYPHCWKVAKRGSKQKDTTTAMCFSTSFGVKHVVAICEAKLVDENSIDLLIHQVSPAYLDELKIQATRGVFTCQYLTSYPGPMETDLIWTTKRQELTLDKKAYRKGDVIKGRIDFECLQEATSPKFIEKHGKYPLTIKVWGVFKTTVE